MAGTVGAVDFILEYQNTAEQDAINNELNFTIPEIFGTSVISVSIYMCTALWLGPLQSRSQATSGNEVRLSMAVFRGHIWEWG